MRQVNRTALLALVSKKGVTFYQYNGWRFVPTPIQPSHPPFSAGVTSLAAIFWNGRLVLGQSSVLCDNNSLVINEPWQQSVDLLLLTCFSLTAIGVTNADMDKATGHPSLYTLSFSTRNDLEVSHIQYTYFKYCFNRKVAMWLPLYFLQEAYYQLKVSCEGLRRQAYGRQVAELRREAATTLRTTDPHTFRRPVTIKGNLQVQAASRAIEVSREAALFIAELLP